MIDSASEGHSLEARLYLSDSNSSFFFFSERLGVSMIDGVLLRYSMTISLARIDDHVFFFKVPVFDIGAMLSATLSEIEEIVLW